MLDVEVMRATADERDAACAMVETKRDGTVLGDTGFVKAACANDVRERCDIRLRTVPRSNQQQHVAPALRRLFNQVRHIIEPVNGQ